MKTLKKTLLRRLNRTIVALDRLFVGRKREGVNHPAHYNKEGRKECIEEMIEKFGIVAVRNFCLLNAYKYNYRHDMKGGVEDIAKAEWYMLEYHKLGGGDIE